MELKNFKQLIEALPVGTICKYGISEPFSWRGVYAEVAFNIEKQPMLREDILTKIENAYNGTFYGYKGGEYKYCDYTDVHFEEDYSSYTSGGYCSEIIAELEKEKPYISQEHRLASLAFSIIEP